MLQGGVGSWDNQEAGEEDPGGEGGEEVVASGDGVEGEEHVWRRGKRGVSAYAVGKRGEKGRGGV